MKLGLFALAPLALVACNAAEDTGEAPCVPMHAVFTDIDETLTTSDGEWMAQLGDPTHDPEERDQAAEMMQAYADLGYTVFYVTARGEDLALQDGRTAREATMDWLVAHSFPVTEEQVFLASGYGASGDAAVAYKSAVLDEKAAAGWALDYAYGNADSDILAFQASGVADEDIFLVGELAGTMGVQPITDADAFAAHMAAHMGGVPAVSCPE
ncbi:MAG: hypothetical protein JXX28_08495 [Deltaproteobacteria bacterium]|nr:hypothetical protein [Deltaproteobacteria bacterium]